MLAIDHGYIKNNQEQDRKRQADMLREQQQAKEAQLRAAHNREVITELTALKDQRLQELESLVELKTWSLKDTLRSRIAKIKASLTYESIPDQYEPTIDQRMREYDQALAQRFSLLADEIEGQIDKAGEIDEAIPHAFKLITTHYQDLSDADHPRVILSETEPCIVAFKGLLNQLIDTYTRRFEILKKDLQEGYDIWSRDCKKYHQLFQSTVEELKALDDQFLTRIQDVQPLMDALDTVHVKACQAGIRLLMFIQAGKRPDGDILINARNNAKQTFENLAQGRKQRGIFYRFTAEGRAKLKAFKTSERIVKRYEMIEADHMKDVTALTLYDQGLCAKLSGCRWYHFAQKNELKAHHAWLADLIVMLDKQLSVDDLYQRLEEPSWAQAKHLFKRIFVDCIKIISQYKSDETMKSLFKSEALINLRYEINEASELWEKLMAARAAFNTQLKTPQLAFVSMHSIRGYFSSWTQGDIVRTTKATPESLSNLPLRVL